MPQVCPSPSRQLEAAAAAFRKARQKFPRNTCSGDTEGYPLQVYPMIAGAKLSSAKSQTNRTDSKTDCNSPTDRFCISNHRSGGNQSTSFSRTASWSRDCRVGQWNGADDRCEACGGCRDCSHASKQMISGLENCLKEAACKSTHSSFGTKRRSHRRPCVRVRERIQTEQQICYLHGFPATRRRSTIPRKPQNQRYRDRKESPSTRGKADHPTACEPQNKVYCGDSPALIEFPPKILNWERQTQQRSSPAEEIAVHDPATMEKWSFSEDQVPKLSRNREAPCDFCIRQTDNSLCGSKKGREPASDVCLRPSLIKAAQRRATGPRSHQGLNLCGQGAKHAISKSGWDENLPIINHKDSVSILMDRFRGNDKRSLGLRNISELNSVLGSKTSCGEGGNFDDEESIDTNLPARKSSSGVNPVRKLGRVANQGLRDNESRFKNLRARLNRSGVCCSSPKGTACRRAF